MFLALTSFTIVKNMMMNLKNKTSMFIVDLV